MIRVDLRGLPGPRARAAGRANGTRRRPGTVDGRTPVGARPSTRSAGQVAARGDAEDLGEPLVRGDPALHLGRVAAVALQAAVDAADRLAEAALVDHRIVRGHRAG